MDQLRGLFTAGKPAKTGQLLGTWAKVREIWTEQALTGRNGPDHVFDIRRMNKTGHSTDWSLTFHDSGGKLQATSYTAWKPTGDSSYVKFESGGDFVFEKQMGGDSNYIFRCRAINESELVCLDARSHGHAIEFRKER